MTKRCDMAGARMGVRATTLAYVDNALGLDLGLEAKMWEIGIVKAGSREQTVYGIGDLAG